MGEGRREEEESVLALRRDAVKWLAGIAPLISPTDVKILTNCHEGSVGGSALPRGFTAAAPAPRAPGRASG